MTTVELTIFANAPTSPWHASGCCEHSLPLEPPRSGKNGNGMTSPAPPMHAPTVRPLFS